jgi:hypothetical protein
LSHRPRRRRIAFRRLWAAAVKAARLGPRGWWLHTRALAAILRASSQVHRVPRGNLIGDFSQPEKVAASALPADQERVETIARAIERAARLTWPRPRCLVRSLAFQRLLLDEGIPGSRIRIGVRMGPRGFEAHAWVEWQGSPIGEDPAYVETFGPMPDLQPGQVPLSWAPSASAP